MTTNRPTHVRLSPAGQQRRSQILDDVLTAAQLRRARRRRMQSIAGTAFVLLLAGSLWFMFSWSGSPSGDSDSQITRTIAETSPRPGSNEQQQQSVEVSEAVADSQTGRSRTLAVEIVSTESLLAELDTAGLPYYIDATGQIHLIRQRVHR